MAQSVDINMQGMTEELENRRRLEIDQAFMQGYMGTTLPVLGVKTHDLRTLAKEFVAEHKADYTGRDWLAWLDLLYAGPTFEHRVLAGMTLHVLPKLRKSLELDRLRTWIAELEGWGAIDNTCQNGWTAREMLDRWIEWQPFLASLATDRRISLRRASLVLPLAPMRESDDPRLLQQSLHNVEVLNSERNVLITKAVSWSLRTMIKHHPQQVKEYLDANQATLPKTTVREVRFKLETGTKKGDAKKASGHPRESPE